MLPLYFLDFILIINCIFLLVFYLIMHIIYRDVAV